MKIMCVTALSPSRIGLNEYGRSFYGVSSFYQDHQFVFISDRDMQLDQAVDRFDNSRVERVWIYNDSWNLFRIIRCALREKPDAIWFNLILSSFGDRFVPAFFGLLTPLALRLLGFKCFTTLHHLSKYVELDSTKYVKLRRLVLLFTFLAEQALAASGVVMLLLDKYVVDFRRSYLCHRVVRVNHGFPEFKSRSRPHKIKNIVVFGKFGSYKRLEFPLEVFRRLKSIDPSWTMTMAGSSHPSYPGYYEGFAAANRVESGITFLNYVPEEQLAELFSNAGLAMLPYSSATGVSGVAHLAATFGVPVVASNIDDFVAMEKEENIGIRFFERNDVDDAVDVITRIMEDDQEWSELSKKSLKISQERSFKNILGSYIKIFQES